MLIGEAKNRYTDTHSRDTEDQSGGAWRGMFEEIEILLDVDEIDAANDLLTDLVVQICGIENSLS